MIERTSGGMVALLMVAMVAVNLARDRKMGK